MAPRDIASRGPARRSLLELGHRLALTPEQETTLHAMMQATPVTVEPASA
jgi:hypothetical protein